MVVEGRRGEGGREEGRREGEKRREGRERRGEKGGREEGRSKGERRGKGRGHRPGIASITSCEGVSLVILPPSTSAGHVGSTYVGGTG